MLLGIIIGICIWQLVVGVVAFIDPCFDTSWITCPLFNVLLALAERVLFFFQALGNYKAYLYLFSIGKNPFCMRVSDLQNLTLEQKEELVKRSMGKYQNAMKKLIKMYH